MTKFELIYILLIVIKIICIFIIYFCVEKQIEDNRKQIQKLRADNFLLIVEMQKMMMDKQNEEE